LEKHQAIASSAQQNGYGGMALTKGSPDSAPRKRAFLLTTSADIAPQEMRRGCGRSPRRLWSSIQQKKLMLAQTVGNYSMMILAVTFLVL
jgi:hypothetical protein